MNVPQNQNPDRTYNQLYLGYGGYEDATLSDIPVAGRFEDGGFPTWQEAVEHFRTCLIAVVRQKKADADENKDCCKACAGATLTDETKFCSMCGRKFQTEEDKTDDLNLSAAEMFRSWFAIRLHEFGDEWQMLEALGWSVCQTTSGGFVKLSDFDQIIEDWDNEDERRDGNRFWNSDLIQTGEVTVDNEG